MDTRTEPVRILEASGHRIAAAAHAAPGMGPVGAAEIFGLQELLQRSLGCGTHRDCWVLAWESTGEQESQVHSFITGISSCLRI